MNQKIYISAGNKHIAIIARDMNLRKIGIKSKDKSLEYIINSIFDIGFVEMNIARDGNIIVEKINLFDKLFFLALSYILSSDYIIGQVEEIDKSIEEILSEEI